MKARVLLVAVILVAGISLGVFFQIRDSGLSAQEQHAYELGYLDNVIPTRTCADWSALNLRLDEIRAEEVDDYEDGCHLAREEAKERISNPS